MSKINKVKCQMSKINKVKCQMSKSNKVKCQMSKINKVNFDGAYLRSSSSIFSINNIHNNIQIYLQDLLIWSSLNSNIYSGVCSYIPPGMFKSTCNIDITWFPFDDQVNNFIYQDLRSQMTMSDTSGCTISDEKFQIYLYVRYQMKNVRYIMALDLR